MPFKTPHPVFQTTDTFQQLVDDLNTYGNTVDSNFHYVDSAVGPDAGSGFHLNGLLTTSGNLIDALNELDSDLHGGPGTFKALTTTEAKHVVGAINEIEAVFDASASTIDTTAGLTVTSAGTETHNITGHFNVNTSGSMDLDAGGDITLDADGNDIIFRDGASTRLQHTLGATNTITSTGNYTVDATGNITLDADGNNIYFKDGASHRISYSLGASNTVAVNGNYKIDATGDITLDADGNDILFKNGADGDTVYHRIYASQDYHIEAPAGIKLTANNDTVIIEGSNTSSARATFNMDTSPTVTFTGATNIANTSGSFWIGAAQYAYIDATLGRVYFQHAGVNKIIHFLDASVVTAQIAGGYTVDATGDIILDADGADIIFKDGGVTAYNFSSAGTISRTGNIIIDASGDITLDADGNDIYFNDGASTRLRHTLGATNTVTSTGNYTVDATGDITLDADGNDIIFKNGADGDTVYHRIYASQQYHIEAPSGIKLTANNDTVILEGSSTSSARATFDMDTSPTVTFTGSTNIGNTSGSFTIDAAQYAILDATLGRVYFQYAGTNKITHFLDAATITAEIAGGYTVDATGDIVLDADGGDVAFKDAGVTAYNFSSTGTIARTGDLAFDVSGDINLDADGQHIRFKDAGTTRLQYTMGTTNTVASTGHYTIDATGDITLAADGNDILFRDAASTRVRHTLGATNTVAYTGNLSQTSTGTYSQTATSYSSNVGAGTYNTTSGNQTHTVGGTHRINATGTVSHTSSGGAFNVTASGGNITLDASGDVVLDADGNDIIFKNGAGADQVKHTLADNAAYSVIYPAGVSHQQSAGDLAFHIPGKDVTFGDGTNERIRLNLEAAPNIYMTGTSASISNSAGNIRIDAVGDVEMDAATGQVNFDQNGTQYAAIYKSGSNVIFRLASNATGFTVNSTNLTVPGVITLPASGAGTITSTEISANTVHGAIDEVNARIPNVYNRAGTLMNP